jgi:hypothetical protein
VIFVSGVQIGRAPIDAGTNYVIYIASIDTVDYVGIATI